MFKLTSLVSVLLLAGFVICANAQEVVEEWVAIYDRPDSQSNTPAAIAVDDMGNVYVTGQTDDGCGRDIVTIKYNAAGEQVWIAFYDGSQYG
jgi:hypothetical protein